MSLRILLVDDDQELTTLLCEYLQGHELQVDVVENGHSALDKVQNQSYSVMVLDIMMPQMNGLDVLRQLRQITDLPVIMLSAKGEHIDRIVGLELGADDYVSKPCNPRELLARIRAVSKRYSLIPEPVETQESESSFIKINLAIRTCEIQGQALDLTGKEFDLLAYLLERTGQPVSKYVLSEAVFHRKLGAYDRSIDVHISRLRKKLQVFFDHPITAIRNQGYQLTINDPVIHAD